MEGGGEIWKANTDEMVAQVGQHQHAEEETHEDARDVMVDSPNIECHYNSLNLWDMSSSTAQPIHERCQGANLTLFSKDSENLVAIKMDHVVM